MRLRAGEVAFGPDRPTLRQPDVADPGIGRHQVRHTVRAVVDDYQFPVGVVLVQEITDGPAHEAPPVTGRHDAGHQRLTGMRRTVRAASAGCLRHDGPDGYGLPRLQSVAAVSG